MLESKKNRREANLWLLLTIQLSMLASLIKKRFFFSQFAATIRCMRTLSIGAFKRVCFRVAGWSICASGRQRHSASQIPARFALTSWRFSLQLAAIGALSLFSVSQESTAAVPAWRAALSEGERHLKIKELVPAEICFREAVRDVRQDKTNSPDDVVLCLESLAGVLQTEDQTQEASPLYKKSLHLLQKAHGADSETVVPTLVSLGNIFRDEALYRPSAKYYRQAMSVVEANSGRSSLKYADVQHRLGLVTFKAGYPTRAEQMYSSSLDVIMQQPRLSDDNILEDTLNDYTDLLRKTQGGGRPLSSVFQAELLKDRVEHLERTQNVDESVWNKKVSVQLINPAGILQNPDESRDNRTSHNSPSSIAVDKQLSDFAALEQINKQRADFYERMIAIDIKTLGPEHPSVARDLTGLAYVFLSQKKYDEAKTLLTRALKIYRSTYGSDPLLIKRTERILSLIDSKQQSNLKSPEPIEDYLSALPKVPVEAQKLESALRLNYLGFLCYSEGKIDEAQKIYAWALAATALSCGQESTLAACCLDDYARVLRSAGRRPEAEQYESTAQKIVSGALVKQSALSLP